MEELAFSRFSELLTMKNQIILCDEKWLFETYKNADDETLEMAFEGIELLFKYDEPFFYLNNEYLDKVIYFIDNIRDNIKYRSVINKIIVSINEVKSRKSDYIEETLKKYIDMQQNLRDSLLDEEILITSFSYDALVVSGLIHDTIGDIREKDFMLASMNYLLQVCPGFFKNEDIREVAIEELNNIKCRRVFTNVVRKYAKDTEKLLKSCK